MDFLKNILFWQPKKDLLKVLLSQKNGQKHLLFFNYIIWLFFAYLSIKILFAGLDTFLQLFLATIIAELVERIVKKRVTWSRPLLKRNHKIPSGFIRSWYEAGSFPSGHTIKAFYFFLIILNFHLFNPFLFILIVLPLLTFRVIMGFHYPIDMIGGGIIGVIIWLVTNIIYVL